MLSALAVLAACGPASQVTYVTRFHALDERVARTFTIVPEASQEGSLEFATYASLVEAQMMRHGYLQAAAEAADLVVHIRYGIEPGRTETTSTPIYGQEAYWLGRYRFEAGTPAPFPLYQTGITDIHTSMLFMRWLELDILDASDLRRGRRAKLFEGRAISEGASHDMPAVISFMIASMFHQFPGRSGQTVKVVLEPADPGAKLPLRAAGKPAATGASR